MSSNSIETIIRRACRSTRSTVYVLRFLLVLEMLRQNKTANAADLDANFAANQLEAQYGVGVFLRLEYQRHLQFIQVR
jgi:hypothetical protein